MDLTRFPHLFSNDFDTENSQWVERHLGGLRFSEATISKAWASLLIAFTGHNEVVFAVDESIVKVDSPSFHLKKIHPPKETHKRGEQSTGVFFRSQNEIPHSALALICNIDSGSAVLKSFGHVPLPFLEHIEMYLKVAVDWFQSHPQSPIPLSSVSTLPKSISNEIPKAFPGTQLLHHLIVTDGDGCAIDFRAGNGERTRLSYQELNDRSAKLASNISLQLENRASRNQPIVAIYLPQSPELYISQIGTLKSGSAFCCVNLDTPQDRLKFILNDICAEILLTSSQFVERLSAIDVKCLLVDDLPSANSKDTPNLAFDAQPEDAAYVMYTSGSTGLPKGVPVSHGAVTQSLLAHDEHIPSFSRFLQFAAPTFDVSIFEIFFTYYKGKTLVSCERMALLNDLVEIMNECDVDAAELTPTVAASLLRNRNSAPKLKLLLTIGEMLTAPVVREFGGNSQQESLLWAMYGPTEAAIHCTLQPALKSSSKVGNIGIPLSTVSAFVISSSGSDGSSGNAIDVLPVGFVGELAIGGHQLAGGYLNRPDQTASVFIDDTPWGRMYRTGDKARMLPDGSFECLGRISSGQVKLRGQRVELGEIEQTALRVKGCSIAAAIIIENMLILFCCVDNGYLSEQLLSECERWLPSHMVPNDIVILKEFPHLASGKVDKKRLTEDYQKSLSYDLTDENSMVDETTSNLYSVLQDVLGRPFPVGSQLTSVGVDSLTAIKFASRLRDMNFNIQPIDILRSNYLSDLRDLALQYVSLEKSEKEGQEKISTQADTSYLEKLARSNPSLESRWVDVDKIAKCSTTQMGMLTETAINSLAYCNWVEIIVPSDVNESTLTTWLRQIVAKHDILRSGFVQTNTPGHEYLQVIWKTIPDSIFESVISLKKGGFSIEDTSLILNPIQFQLSSAEDQVNRLLIRIHHALYDGWSMDLLTKDLELLFNGSTLKSCRQFQQVQEYYDQLDIEESLANWQDHLVRCSPTLLPISDEENNLSKGQSSMHNFSCKMIDLRKCASDLQITPQCYFQAALTYLIGKMVGNPDIMIGTVTSGRMIPVEGIEDIFGPCMRTLPQRVNLSHSKYAADLLKNIHHLNRRLAEYSDISMKDVKKAAGIDPGIPLSDILFIWQESLQTRYDDCVGFQIADSSNNVEFKLVVEIEPRGNEIVGKITSQGWNAPFPLEMFLKQMDEVVIYFVENPRTISENFSAIAPQLSNTHAEHAKTFVVVQDSLAQDETWTKEEDIIRTAISEITGVPNLRVQKHVSIFRYGIDSMSAIHLARFLRQSGLPATSISIILKNSTVFKLARALDSSDQSKDAATASKVDLIPNQIVNDVRTKLVEEGLHLEKVLPCTPLQEAMISSYHSSKSDAYCNLMVFRVVGNPSKLVHSLETVIRRHEIFRTIFIQTDSSDFPFVQAILPINEGIHDTETAVFESNELDLQGLMLRAQGNLARLIDNMTPLVALRKVQNDKDVFIELVCHHAVYDAFAIQILIHEVELYYEQAELRPSPSTEEFLRYSQSLQSEEAENFWTNTLKDFQPVLFHYTKPVNVRAHSRPLAIPLNALETSCRELSTTFTAVFQSALAKLLALVLNTQDVCFGNVVSGRTHPVDSLDRLVFPTFNTVPTRIRFSQLPSNASLLAFFNDFNLSVDPFNLFPLRKIQKALGLAGEALFSTLLLVQQGSYKLNSSIWELVIDSGNMDVREYHFS
jgi:amino acid adenylation domain-containing protein